MTLPRKKKDYSSSERNMILERVSPKSPNKRPKTSKSFWICYSQRTKNISIKSSLCSNIVNRPWRLMQMMTLKLIFISKAKKSGLHRCYKKLKILTLTISRISRITWKRRYTPMISMLMKSPSSRSITRPRDITPSTKSSATWQKPITRYLCITWLIYVLQAKRCKTKTMKKLLMMPQSKQKPLDYIPNMTRCSSFKASTIWCLWRSSRITI